MAVNIKYIDKKGERFGDHKEYLDSLKDRRKTFTLIRTSNTANFDFGNSDRNIIYYADKRLSFKFFGLIQKIKSEIYSSKGLKDILQSEKPLVPRYFDFSDTIYNVAEDIGVVHNIGKVIEVDITKAYYYACRNLKLISNEFFEECITLPKEMRLKLVGSIATNKYLHEYVEGKLVRTAVKDNAQLRKVWFRVCDYVDRAMIDIRNMMEGQDFLFYWVDGIYFLNNKNKNRNLRYINAVMQDTNLDFTVSYINNVEIANIENVIQVNVIKGNKDIKEFYVPKRRVKGYYFGLLPEA